MAADLRMRNPSQDTREEEKEDKQSDAEDSLTSSGLTNKIIQNIDSIAHIPEKIAHMAWKIIPFDSLPHWLKDNEFLQSNYRPPMYSIKGCMKSMFRLHTETWNIWTHLVGFVFFTFLTFGVYIFRDYITQLFEDNVTISELPWEEQFMLLLFFLGAITCLFCSTAFHTLSNHSEYVYKVTSKLDYSGIAFLITGSSIPAYYYAFYCIKISRYFHICTLIVLCIGCLFVSYKKKFGMPGYRVLRFSVFVSFGLYGVIPAVHLMIIKGLEEPNYSYLVGLIVMALLYLLGAGLYVLRIPERFKPGAFDVWAHSHQLFHVCVVAAAIVHYDTLLFMVKHRLSAGACAGSVEALVNMVAAA